VVTNVREGNKVAEALLATFRCGSRQPPHTADLQRSMTIPIQGTAALVVAAAIVAATAIWMPAYRWFLLISIGIGAAVAGGLYLWHELRPVKDDDVENKRPLGLS
jgi:hypothetical protein